MNKVIVAVLTAALCLASPTLAHADDEGFDNTGTETIIYGGTTQSDDPTAYDYVPSEPVMEPRSAAGWGVIGSYNLDVYGVSVVIPGGFLYHKITGEGKSVTYESGTYYSQRNVTAPWTITLCNIRIDWQNRNNDRIYTTSIGNTRTGCFKEAWPARYDYSSRTLKTGQQCARIWVGGKFRGEQCHWIP